MTQLTDDLDALNQFFSDEGKWIKRSHARTKKKGGSAVRWDSEKATCWCLDGAALLLFRDPSPDHKRYNAVVAALNRATKAPDFVHAQDRDSFTFDDLKKLIADARALASE